MAAEVEERLAILGARGHGKAIADFEEYKVACFGARWLVVTQNGCCPIEGSEQGLATRRSEFSALAFAIGNTRCGSCASDLETESLPVATLIHLSAVVCRLSPAVVRLRYVC